VPYFLISQYYGPEGIGYTIVRVPIGGTDFSTRNYTYDDGAVDITLSRFKLADEDYKFKVRKFKESFCTKCEIYIPT
jgi:glucosylceramidase